MSTTNKGIIAVRDGNPGKHPMHGNYVGLAAGNLTSIKTAMVSMMQHAAKENGGEMPRAYSIIIKTREFVECETPADLVENLSYPLLTVGIKWHMDSDLNEHGHHRST